MFNIHAVKNERMEVNVKVQAVESLIDIPAPRRFRALNIHIIPDSKVARQ